MNTDDLLKKLGELIDQKLDPIITAQQEQGKAIANVKQGQAEQGQTIAHISTAIETLATKQDVETTVDAAKAELKADILILESKLIKKVQSHERRLANVEEKTNTPNPDKN